MNPVMYIIANRGAEMSPGKLAAQVAHAAVEAYRMSDRKLIDAWYEGGHHTKIVLAVDTEDALQNAATYIRERGFDCKEIIDEGRTEIKPFTMTAVGVEILNKDNPHVAATFESFRTYKPLLQAKPKKRFWGSIVFGS